MTCLPKPLLASDVVETSLPKDEPNRVQDKEVLVFLLLLFLSRMLMVNSNAEFWWSNIYSLMSFRTRTLWNSCLILIFWKDMWTALRKSELGESHTRFCQIKVVFLVITVFSLLNKIVGLFLFVFRLREERLKRIGRYKARLALLLPPFGEQWRNE